MGRAQNRSMSAKPIVAVDLDEVLGHFVAGLCGFHNTTYGTALTPESFHSYRFADVWGGTDAESATKVHAFFDSAWFADLPTVHGALETLQSLAPYLDFVVVTSRQHCIEDKTRAWIDTHYPGVFSHIVFGNHWGVGHKRSKEELCREVGARALIDDAVDYVLQCAGIVDVAVLFGDYAWNRSAGRSLPANVVRVRDWTQVPQLLRATFPSSFPQTE